MSLINKIFTKSDTDKKDEKAVKKTATVSDEKKQEAKKEEKKSTTKTTAVSELTKVQKKEDLSIYKILQSPLITEKVTDLVGLNKYVFQIPVSATKNEVKKKIINCYGIKPIKINIVNVKGKQTRYGRTKGKRKDWKKAIVTLAPGEKIEIYEGV